MADNHINIEAERELSPDDVLGMMRNGILTNQGADALLRGERVPLSLDHVWGLVNSARTQAFKAARRPAADGAALDLPPIEYDRDMDRTYIPLPGGWEIQTKGKGSTFRIAHVPSRKRWMVLDDDLHEMLEALARDMRNALAAHYQRKQGGEVAE